MESANCGARTGTTDDLELRDRIAESLAAQGARIAALEAERDTYKEGAETLKILLEKERAEVDRLKGGMREAAIALDGSEASHEDEEAAHAETLALLDAAKAEVQRLKAELEQATAIIRRA